MSCKACWVNNLNKIPCLQGPEWLQHVHTPIPMTVTMNCYAMMTQSWSRPGGRVALFVKLDGLPVSRIECALSTPLKMDRLERNVGLLTSNPDEFKKIIAMALDIWPRKSPWTPFLELGRVIELERAIVIEHAPFVLDDGTARRAYAEGMGAIVLHGPPQKVTTWDEWFELAKEKERERDAERKKSDGWS